MAKSCINHGNAPAITMCTQCHKPICQSCTMVTPMGKFCSSECSIINRETKTKLKESSGGGGGSSVKVFVFVLLLVVLGAVCIHMFKGTNQTLHKIDIIGKILGDKGVKPATNPGK
jgi:hypothetical protein